jgi:Zn-dependent protease with chaperone function
VRGEELVNSLIYPKERLYFYLALIVSIIIYAALALSVIGLLYIAIAVVFAFFAQGIFIGNIKGNGIKVSEKQFPEVYSIAKQLAAKMDLTPIPDIYVVQQGGLLNAFATKFLGRNFVIIYSDVLEIAYEKREAELAFIICHELAHIKRKHLSRLWFLYPAILIPFLGSAYSRACEYTCDRFGANYSPEGAVSGLLVLAAGKKLHSMVNVEEFGKQIENEGGFWVWLSEHLSTHPNLSKRIRALQEFCSAIVAEKTDSVLTM